MLSFRRYKRIHLQDYLRVRERHSGELLGYLSNITIDGAQVINTLPFEQNKEYQLSIELPMQLGICQDLEVDAHIVWVSPDRVPNFYDAGFRFGNLSAEGKRVVYDLITHYGMDGNEGYMPASAMLH